MKHSIESGHKILKIVDYQRIGKDIKHSMKRKLSKDLFVKAETNP